MSLYVCEKCGCIDNTACGGQSVFRNSSWVPEESKGKYLCCECTPIHFSDGSINEDAGKWHNRFPKRKYTEEDRDRVINPPVKLKEGEVK